jgi:hypothetical protein
MSQPSPTDKSKLAARPAAAGAPEGNVDQIRDILFGGQMRDYERRFEELEERSKREAERARADVAKRLENLEQLLRDQADRHAAQLKKLDAEFKLSVDAAASALLNARQEATSASEKLGKALRAELSEVDEKHEIGASSLRERLHKLANETADAMRGGHDEISGVIERMGTNLRDEKVAREELAGFFSEMALRLTRQFDLPKSQVK